MSLNFVPHVPASPPSARAQELGMRLAEVIREYNRQHADVSPVEIRQALMIAAGQSGGGGEARRVLVALVAALVVGMGLALALAVRSGAGGAAGSFPIMGGALVLFAIVVIVILVRRGS